MSQRIRLNRNSYESPVGSYMIPKRYKSFRSLDYETRSPEEDYGTVQTNSVDEETLAPPDSTEIPNLFQPTTLKSMIKGFDNYEISQNNRNGPSSINKPLDESSNDCYDSFKNVVKCLGDVNYFRRSHPPSTEDETITNQWNDEATTGGWQPRTPKNSHQKPYNYMMPLYFETARRDSSGYSKDAQAWIPLGIAIVCLVILGLGVLTFIAVMTKRKNRDSIIYKKRVPNLTKIPPKTYQNPNANVAKAGPAKPTNPASKGFANPTYKLPSTSSAKPVNAAMTNPPKAPPYGAQNKNNNSSNNHPKKYPEVMWNIDLRSD
ncbi:uncharacterized protein LOC135929911 [Gordionus sp. m RMFG-2023]|uniref:uncharacterized protein LOC135929911 n=3 Tax=Gordionus sp. m RMFG-2023 TaxID=3053472 RepID=UPI0031FD638D